MPHVFLYAALLSLMYFGLSIRTLRLRRKLRIVVGDAGNMQMLRAMRVHSNFAEYVPITLLIVYFAELSGAPAVWVHAMGASLIFGRGLHAFGVSQLNERYGFRVTGMTLTFLPLLAGATTILLAYARTAPVLR